jgi:hypothetical protein
MKRALWLLLGIAALAACSSAPKSPDWELNAVDALRRATDAHLSGRTGVADSEFRLARAEVARTARVDQAARVELTRCATRVASLQFEPCAGARELQRDLAKPEAVYLAYLEGQALDAADTALLPEAQRSLLANPAALADPKLDPLSKLVAAGVALQRNVASPTTIQAAIDTAAQQGWARPLLAWLTLAKQRAEAAGAAEEAARIQRRIDLVTRDARLK